MFKIMFDIVPAKGHFNNTLKLACTLKKKGHEVFFIGHESFEKIVKHFEINFLIHSPFIIIPQQVAGRFSHNLLNLIYKSRINEARANLESLKKLINATKPDLVLLDEQNVLKALVYQLLGIRVLLVQTMLDPRRNGSIPPFTSYHIPKNSYLDKKFCSWLWFQNNIKRKIRRNYLAVITFMQDDISIYKKLLKNSGINLNSLLNCNYAYGLGINGIKRLILSPYHLEFNTHLRNSLTHYVGPVLFTDETGSKKDVRYQFIVDRARKLKRQNNGYIIYCSLGTLTELNLKIAFNFFRKLSKTAQLSSNDVFVLSVGNFIKVHELFPVSKNVFIFNHVIQSDLLKHVDIMITHGGMNSITECILAEIPMLVYPLSDKWDQPGNAARVRYHGIGLYGKIKKSTVADINGKLNQIKLEYSIFQNKIIEIKKKFENKNRSNEAINIIGNYLNQ